ncbi:hypothetical protein GHK92_04965 [Nocardioides sp. dk4132]|uniref:hypothetical protein n=1 Tax=unclassified Nocardioides TaxID=2615069 RepID=UPI001295EF71|nr:MULTISPECIES: hypothetical protein [unclassified Nocardioides]MQW75217.1 hypothetical protein [Nocardioides sp. dk4132]QGA07630.1 hypothetical protein GFH29_09635 [Nocardioides sp. dk884]
MTRSTFRPRRGLVAGVAASGLLLGAAAVGVGPSPAAAAPPGCDQPFPTAELTRGQVLSGLTVVQGTEPVAFEGTVIGVLDDGISAGLDMIMVDVEVPDIELPGGGQANGIWQGMSGSPLYAADGRVVGAISYGMAWGSSPVAGVTPFAEMEEFLEADPAPRLPVPPAMARAIAASTDLTVAQAGRGMRELTVPMGVSGVSQRTLDMLAAKAEALAKRGIKRPYLKSASYRLARSTAAPADASAIKPGGNLATTASYGDVIMGGVGTVTSVCGDRVVGFGHPAYSLGATSLGLHPADAVYVQPDPAGVPFKLANISAPVGTINDDRRTAIAGRLGALPDAIALTSALALDGETLTGRTEVYVDDAAADAVYYQFSAAHERLLDNDPMGSELLTWTITGTDAAGAPFTLRLTDRFAGPDALWEATYGVADFAWGLSRLEGVEMRSIDLRADLSRDARTLDIARVEQHRNGSWTTVNNKTPIQARAGRTIKLRLVMTAPGGTKRYHRVSFAAPAAKYRSATRVSVTSGSNQWNSTSFKNLAGAKKLIATTLRNDQVRVQYGTSDKVQYAGDYYGEEMYYRAEAKRPKSFLRTRVSAPYDRVVTGAANIKVKILK